MTPRTDAHAPTKTVMALALAISSPSGLLPVSRLLTILSPDILSD